MTTVKTNVIIAVSGKGGVGKNHNNNFVGQAFERCESGESLISSMERKKKPRVT